MTHRYVRRVDLHLLLSGLSHRDLAILRDLQRYRLLSGDQLRRRHFTEHASRVASARAMTGTMRRLRDHGLVDHLVRRIGGSRAGSASYVWHLTVPGQRLLLLAAGSEQPARLDAPREPGLRTAEHTLAIAEFGVRLHEEARRGRLEVIECAPEPASWRAYLNAGGGISRLKPDLFVVTAVPEASTESVAFIEIDRATTSLAAVTRKAEQYAAYHATGREQLDQGTFPRIVWIVPHQQRAKRIAAALASSRRVDPALHWIGTLGQFIGQTTERSAIDVPTANQEGASL